VAGGGEAIRGVGVAWVEIVRCGVVLGVQLPWGWEIQVGDMGFWKIRSFASRFFSFFP